MLLDLLPQAGGVSSKKDAGEAVLSMLKVSGSG